MDFGDDFPLPLDVEAGINGSAPEAAWFIYLGALVAVVAIWDILSGVMIFAFSTWFALPWAYDAKIKKNSETKLKNLGAKGIADEASIRKAKAPTTWIKESRRAFLLSGIALFGSLFMNYGNELSTITGPLDPQLLATEMVVILGVAALLFGTIRAYHIIEFASDANYYPTYGVPDILFLVGVANLGAYDLVQLVAFLPLFDNFVSFTWWAQSFLMTWLISPLGIFIGVARYESGWTKSKKLAILFLVLPWAESAILIMTGLWHPMTIFGRRA